MHHSSGITTGHRFYRGLKGLLSVISSDPLCKDDNAWLTTVLLRQYLPHYWSDNGFKSTVVNRALLSLQEGSLEIALAVLLGVFGNYFQKFTLLRYANFLFFAWFFSGLDDLKNHFLLWPFLVKSTLLHNVRKATLQSMQF